MLQKRIAIFPGSFDPITKGHIHLIERASRLCDHLIIAIANSEYKSPLFSLEERLFLVKNALSHLNNIEVSAFSELLIDFAKKNQANFFIRGIRNTLDLAHEQQLAILNQKLYPKIETIFLFSDEQFMFISSTIVKEIAKHFGEISQFVDPKTEQKLKEKFQQK